MSIRTATIVRTVLSILVVAGLSLVPVVAGTGGVVASGGTGTLIDKNQLAKRTPGAPNVGQDETVQSAVQYDREIPFWPFAKGPEYGYLPAELAGGSNALHLAVGSFDTRTAGLALPPELVTGDTVAAGQKRYFLIQLTQSAGEAGSVAFTLKQLEQTGAALIEYLPSNAWVVRVDAASLAGLRASSSLQYVQPFQPAYKLNPAIGQRKLLDKAKAASDDYMISVQFFPGERPAIEAAIQSLGGTFVPGQEKEPIILANLKGAKILRLALVEGVRQINEQVPAVTNSEESQLIVLTGGYTVAGESSFYRQGVNGSNGYLFDCDCNNDGTVNATGCPGSCGAAADIDYNGNLRIDSGAQIVMVCDSGMSVDASDFSETNATTGTITTSGTELTFVKGHRKMAGYLIAPGAGASGDLATCDSGGSGSFTHGQTTSGSAVGNASQVPNGLANGEPLVDWNGDGTLNSYGTGIFFPSGSNQVRSDGVAKGARLFFEDASPGPCPETTSTGVFPGVLDTDLTTAHSRGARLHNFSFGVAGTTGTYDADAQGIDTFLINNTTSMVFVSAGNDGDDNGDVDQYGQPTTLGNGAQNKNAVTVGASRHDAPRARASFSSIGPAGGGGGQRIKPDLMAPGQDFGGAGISADYNCRDDDNANVTTADIDCVQQSGYSGTSYSSPNATGAGAIVRDYFARGMYPDGTKENASNNGDRANSISGVMVKAILIASTDSMPGNSFNANNIHYIHRYNNEVGYGAINLSNVLPLTDDPSTPTGLIVHDANAPDVSVKVQSLSLSTAGVTLGQRACDTFKVVSVNEPLTVSLVWNDPTTVTTIVNDLSLELVNPGADGTLDGVNGDDVRYYGNIFTEDANDDGTIDTTCDLNNDGVATDSCDLDNDASIDQGGNSLGICRACGDIDGDGTSNSKGAMPNSGLCDGDNNGSIATTECDAAPIDLKNTTEAIFLVSDPRGDGNGPGFTADNQIRTGTWKVCVNRRTGAGGAQKYALVIAGGVTQQSAVRLDTNPIKCNGDMGVAVTELADGTDCCVSAASCNVDTCIEPRTRIVVRHPSFDSDGIDNNGVNGIDEVIPDVDGDGTADGESLVDYERAGLGFQLAQTPDQLSFSQVFRIPGSGDPALRYKFNDGNLSVADGEAIAGYYRDTVSAVLAERRSNASVGCTANFDLFNLGNATGRDFPFALSGGCDTDLFLDKRERFGYDIQVGNLDTETLIKPLLSLRARKPIEADGFDNDADGTIDENDGTEATADPCRTKCTLASCNMAAGVGAVMSLTPDPNSDGVAEISLGDFDNNISQTFIGTKTVGFAINVKDAAVYPAQVEMVIGLKSDASGDTETACKVFRHLLDADGSVARFSTDYPTGIALVDQDYDGNETIENPISDPAYPFPPNDTFSAGRYIFDKLFETYALDNLQTTAFGTTGNSAGNPGLLEPWDFDTGDNGFRSGIYGNSDGGGLGNLTNWGEDENFNNILDGPRRCDIANNPLPCTTSANCPGSAACRAFEDYNGDKDGSLDQNWSTLGGCGFSSRNGAAKGIWHTGTIRAPGLATCSATDETVATISCEYLDTTANHVGGGKRWLEFLVTPVMNKVHKRPNGALCGDGKDNDGDGACKLGTNNGTRCTDLQGTNTSGTCTGSGVCQRIDEDDNGDSTCDEGFGYTLEMWDWRWNLNADYKFVAPGYEQLRWELDEDTTNLEPSDLFDRFALNAWADGAGPLNGSNADLVNGFPMFALSEPTATSSGQQRNGVSDSTFDGTPDQDSNRDATIDAFGGRLSNRSCVFETVPVANRGFTFRLRDPGPYDDDCDAEAAVGPDGKPGAAGVDDNFNGVVDDAGELCPCWRVNDGQDDDADGAIDDPQELQRFWTCSTDQDGTAGLGTSEKENCRTNTDCPTGSGVCRQFGHAAPYGDDICGDGTIDDTTYGGFARGTLVKAETGHRVAQNSNFGLITVNGTPLRVQTLEDVYDTDAGESFQGMIGVQTRDFDTPAHFTQDYGFAVDDMVLEWTETVPVAQGTSKCAAAAGGTPAGGTGGSPTGGGGTDASPDTGTAPQCAALTLGSDVLYEPSASLSVQVVDVNAATTQAVVDVDGTLAVEVVAISLDEDGETFRLKRTTATSDTYEGQIPVSNLLNRRNDGLMFVQWRAGIFPQFTVRYVDKNDGVSGTDNGADGTAGVKNVDDDFDSYGSDKRPGVAGLDDDGTGQCDVLSTNRGALCASNSDCTGSGNCVKIDNAAEGCASSASTPKGDDQCAPIDTNADGTTDKGVDETDERCPFGGKKTLFSDDRCGCALNPIDAGVISDFDSADIVLAHYNFIDNGSGGTSGDGDGIPDSTEKLRLSVVVRNVSADQRLQNVKLKLNTRDATISCITDDSISIASMSQQAFVNSPSNDPFEFIVANVNRTSMVQSKTATFQITAEGNAVDTVGKITRFYGTAVPVTFTTDLDLDASVASVSTLKATDKRVIIFNVTTGTASNCGATKECYNLVANDANNFYKKWAASAFPNRPGLHCQQNDPSSPFGVSGPPGCFIAQDTGVIFVDNDRDGTSDPGNTDWHFHTSGSRPFSGGTNQTVGRGHDNAPFTVANSQSGALHMGFHDRNGAGVCKDPDGTTNRTCDNSKGDGIGWSPSTGVDYDNYHIDNIFEVHYKSPFRIGLGRGDYDGTVGTDEFPPVLSFWHQMAMSWLYQWDDAAVMALVDRTDDGTIQIGGAADATKDGQWKKLQPYYGLPSSLPTTFINCKFDPDDDGNTEKDLSPGQTQQGPSSLCFPEIVWTCAGDTQDDPYNLVNQFPADLGLCYPEGNARADGAGVDENGDGLVNGADSGIITCTSGNCGGQGKWVEAKFDLSEFRGRSIFIRYLVGMGSLSARSWNEWGQDGNSVNGWYIDDMTVSGLQCGGNNGTNACTASTGFGLRIDGGANPNVVCPADNCPTNPTASLRLSTYLTGANGFDDNGDGTIDEIGETNANGVVVDAPGRLVTLNATGSSVAQCIGGQLEYEFVADGDLNGTYERTVQASSALNTTTDNPATDTTYRVNVRCSSDTACAASDDAAAYQASTFGGVPLFLLKGSVVACWPAAIPQVDIIRGSISSLITAGGNFASAGLVYVNNTVTCGGADTKGGNYAGCEGNIQPGFPGGVGPLTGFCGGSSMAFGSTVFPGPFNGFRDCVNPANDSFWLLRARGGGAAGKEFNAQFNDNTGRPTIPNAIPCP